MLDLAVPTVPVAPSLAICCDQRSYKLSFRSLTIESAVHTTARLNAANVSRVGELSNTEKTTRSNRSLHGPLRRWLTKAAATTVGSLRNTPQPQAPSTNCRYPREAANANMNSERLRNTPGICGNSSGRLSAVAPALGAGLVMKVASRGSSSNEPSSTLR